MALDQEFDSLEWAALNSWADSRQSGRVGGGSSKGGGKGAIKSRAKSAGDSAIKKTGVAALVTKRRAFRERPDDITGIIERGAGGVVRSVKGTAVGIGASVLGPAGALVSVGGPLAAILAIAAIGITATDLFLTVEERKLFARRAIKPDEVFESFGISALYSSAKDEIKAYSGASFQYLSDVFQGGGFLNSAARYAENLQRNRNILMHPRLLDEIRDMRRESIREINSDNRRQGGMKRQGLNGG